jgi:hypothetical protein
MCEILQLNAGLKLHIAFYAFHVKVHRESSKRWRGKCRPTSNTVNKPSMQAEAAGKIAQMVDEKRAYYKAKIDMRRDEHRNKMELMAMKRAEHNEQMEMKRAEHERQMKVLDLQEKCYLRQIKET